MSKLQDLQSVQEGIHELWRLEEEGCIDKKISPETKVLLRRMEVELYELWLTVEGVKQHMADESYNNSEH